VAVVAPKNTTDPSVFIAAQTGGDSHDTSFTNPLFKLEPDGYITAGTDEEVLKIWAPQPLIEPSLFKHAMSLDVAATKLIPLDKSDDGNAGNPEEKLPQRTTDPSLFKAHVKPLLRAIEQTPLDKLEVVGIIVFPAAILSPHSTKLPFVFNAAPLENKYATPL
jgi:hypothetical protein